MELQPDDILFIPASLSKSIASHTAQGVMSLAHQRRHLSPLIRVPIGGA